jgi:hypothetical protein
MAASRLMFLLLFIGAVLIGAIAGGLHTRRDILEPELPNYGRVTIPRIAVRHPATNPTRDPKIVPDKLSQNPLGLLHFASAHNDFDTAEEELTALVHSDPGQALDAVLTLPSHIQRRALEIVLREWLKSSPDFAWQFIASSFPGFFASKEFAESISWARRFDLAAQALNRLITAEAKSEASNHLFAAWNSIDPTDFEIWAKKQSGALRSAAFSELAASAIARGSSPLRAWAPELGDPVANRRQWHCLASRLIELGGHDVASAAFTQYPQSDALWPIYSLLARTDDPAESEAWLSKIQNNESRSLATISAVVYWTERDIATAAWFSLQVGNPVVTRNQLMRILPRWAAQDPQAAINFIEHSSTLESSTRSELLSLIRGAPPGI